VRIAPCVIGALALVVGACVAPESVSPEPASPWQVVAEELPAALLSVAGRGAADVWAVGADAGDGPWVVHYDGARWTRKRTGDRGDLWWVHPAADGALVAGGAGGRVLVHAGGRWNSHRGPGEGTVYGVWADGADDAWAVGGRDGADGFLWRLRGGALEAVALPDDRPKQPDGRWPALLKVWRGAGGVWVVGDQGTILLGEDGVPFRTIASGTRERLFTVHGDSAGPVVVGGTSSGLILEGRQGPEGWAFANVAPRAAPLLQGVFVGGDGAGLAVGLYGTSFERQDGAWSAGPRSPARIESLHAAWRDGAGRSWACGGSVLSSLDRGMLLVRGGAVAPLSAGVEVVE
jgi:hypothetical protein